MQIFEGNHATKQWCHQAMREHHESTDLSIPCQVKLPPARPTDQPCKSWVAGSSAPDSWVPQSDVSKGSKLKEIKAFFFRDFSAWYHGQSSLDKALFPGKGGMDRRGHLWFSWLLVPTTDFRPPYHWPAGPFSIFPIRPTSHIPNPSCMYHSQRSVGAEVYSFAKQGCDQRSNVEPKGIWCKKSRLKIVVIQATRFNAKTLICSYGLLSHQPLGWHRTRPNEMKSHPHKNWSPSS